MFNKTVMVRVVLGGGKPYGYVRDERKQRKIDNSDYRVRERCATEN
jgi:hypothetical protein